MCIKLKQTLSFPHVSIIISSRCLKLIAKFHTHKTRLQNKYFKTNFICKVFKVDYKL